MSERGGWPAAQPPTVIGNPDSGTPAPGSARYAAVPVAREWPWRADARALAVLAGLAALAVWNRLSFDAWLTRFDLFTFFLPWYAFLGERLREFAIPGWNPHLFSGAPFAGDPESGWMYLPAMLCFALLSAAAAFKTMVAVQIAVAALSTYAFTRVLGMGALASLVAAVVYAVGPLLHWTTYCCLIFGQFATWIPLALLGIELALRADRWRGRLPAWFLGGLAVSQMFAGWAGEGWLYATLLPAAYAGYRGLLSPPRRGITFRERLKVGTATALAVPVLGMALGAAGILPRFAVNAETHLAGGDYSQLGEAGVLNPPWQLDYLLVQVLGTGAGYHYRAAALGGAVVILSALALFMARARFAVPFFAVLTLVALLLTLETTPLHLLFYLIPRYREFHDHDAWRTVALAAIGPAILSGAAVESLARWRGRRQLLPVVVAPLVLLTLAAVVLWRVESFLGWAPLLAAAVTTALVAVVVATRREAGGGRRESNVGATRALPERPAPVEPGEGLLDSATANQVRYRSPSPISRGEGAGYPLGGGVRAFRRHDDRIAQIVPLAILAVIFLQPTGLEIAGSWWGWPRNAAWERRWTPEPGSAAALVAETGSTDPYGAGAFLQTQLAISGPFRYAGYGGILYPGDEIRADSYMGRRFDSAVRALLVNGRPIYLGLYDIQGYNPLQLSRYVEFMTALNGAPQDYHTAFLLPSGVRSPLLDLLNVRYLLVDRTLPSWREDVVALTAGGREVFRTPWVRVYERDPQPPHAWIVHEVREVARGAALPLLTSGTIDPYRTALVEGPPPETREPAADADESAQVVRYEPDAMTIATSTAAPGMLVISEIYASGWRAYVDGEEATILPTDHALRGVPLPAGAHTVEMRYDPLSLRLGLFISAIAVAGMLLAFAAAALSNRPRRD